MVSNKLDEWVKIDIALKNKLKELKVLSKERDALIVKAEQTEFTPEIKQELESSLIKYTYLANEVSALKKQSKVIKSKKSTH